MIWVVLGVVWGGFGSLEVVWGWFWGGVGVVLGFGCGVILWGGFVWIGLLGVQGFWCWTQWRI